MNKNIFIVFVFTGQTIMINTNYSGLKDIIPFCHFQYNCFYNHIDVNFQRTYSIVSSKWSQLVDPESFPVSDREEFCNFCMNYFRIFS